MTLKGLRRNLHRWRRDAGDLAWAAFVLGGIIVLFYLIWSPPR